MQLNFAPRKIKLTKSTVRLQCFLVIASFMLSLCKRKSIGWKMVATLFVTTQSGTMMEWFNTFWRMFTNKVILNYYKWLVIKRKRNDTWVLLSQIFSNVSVMKRINNHKWLSLRRYFPLIIYVNPSNLKKLKKIHFNFLKIK